MTQRQTRISLTCAIAVLISVVTIPAQADPNASNTVTHSNIYDYLYYPPNYGAVWNGWYIYLSPAHHWGGAKSGCDGYIEDTNMPSAAAVAAVDLAQRGYYVRLGRADPDENVTRSNGWTTSTAQRHIALHSNADGDLSSCDTDASISGHTIVFYYSGSTNGLNLAAKLRDKIGEVSPNRPGQVDNIQTGSLYELTYTDSPAAYLEADFHDWNTGEDWLRTYSNWAWRVGYAVDLHLGYP